MNYKKIRYYTLLLLGIGIEIQAQTSINTTGNNVAGYGGTVSYTIGQLVYTTHAASNGTIIQGIQQPYEVSIVTEDSEITNINLALSAYPNPTFNNLILEVKESVLSNLYFQLFDINGKLLELRKITEKQTNINMQNRTPAIYFLKITDGNKKLKTFKIKKK